VELDEQRYEALKDRNRWEKLNILQIVKSGQVPFLMTNLALASFQKRMGLQTGVKPGEELAAAAQTAEDNNIELKLVDRNIRITLLRAWRKTGLWKKLNLIATLIAGMFEKPQLDEEELTNLRQSDNLSAMLEEMGERIEELEEALLESLDQEMLSEIHRLKRETLFLRKSLWPLREVVGRMDRGESRLFQEATRPYIRDLYDHTLQVVDTLENYREMSSALLEVYLTNVSNRTNEVMKVLTVIATLFIPITFLAGVYGMNFDYMPELKWRWGYPAVWVVMIAMGAGMLGYFKSRKWL